MSVADTMPAPLVLYAVVPGEEWPALGAGARGLRTVTCGHLAGVVGKVPRSRGHQQAAVRHDRAVQLALETCSSVVPFRLGLELRSEAELRRVIEGNAQPLAEMLDRFRGRVEMGFKARLTAGSPGDRAPGAPGFPASLAEPIRLPFGLERLRALAPRAADRRERLIEGSRGTFFAGCYLISRQGVDRFWAALDEIRSLLPELPLLGSGPWAPYSFCDLALRYGGEGQETATLRCTTGAQPSLST